MCEEEQGRVAAANITILHSAAPFQSSPGLGGPCSVKDGVLGEQAAGAKPEAGTEHAAGEEHFAGPARDARPADTATLSR